MDNSPKVLSGYGIGHGRLTLDPEAEIVEDLTDHALTKSHARHISAKKAKDELKINISYLETDDKLQDAVLSVHHACIQALTDTPAFKIVENHNGIASIQSTNAVIAVQGVQR